MLHLVRKKGESLVINNNIRIEIVAISGDKVRLCIDAPQEVAIVSEQKKSSKQE